MRYVGQCDLVQHASTSNEVKWQAMMGCAEPVSMRTFLAAVDITPLLDEGETIKGFVRDAQRSDPTTAAFRSWWGPDRCWFLQTAGYEFIFLA